MKKLITFVLALVCALALAGCAQQEEQQQDNILTLDKVVELSAKGEELTWSDFEQYESIETGSGLYILEYDIDETFALHVGGFREGPPLYIFLLTKANQENKVDIRTGNVQEFIAANRK